MDMAHTALALQAHWTRLRPIIQKAVPFMGGTHDEADLLKEVLEGRMSFWPGERSFIIAAIERFPKLVRLNFCLAGGDREEIERIAHKIHQWGKVMGATVAVTEIRPGAERMARAGKLATHEFKSRRTVYVRGI